MNTIEKLSALTVYRPIIAADRFVQRISEWAIQVARADGKIFIVAYAINFAVYSYLFTDFTFTNHSMQNVFVQQYPSYRTVWEGRWLHDIILQIAGGTGTQSLQMFVGVALQVAAGMIFARIIGVRRAGEVLVVALLISLNPTVMDYYSFNSDAISFTLGDFLIVVGVYILLQPGWRRMAVAALCFFLALSVYQPKITILAVVMLVACRQVMLESAVWSTGIRDSLARIAKIAARFLLPAAMACLACWAALKFVVSHQGGSMTMIDIGKSPFTRLATSYVRAAASFSDMKQVLFFPLTWLVLLAIIGGLGAVVLASIRRISVEWALGLVMLALLPPCIYLAYILNDSAWSVAGRLVVAEGYALAFLLSLAWPYAVVRYFSWLASAGLIYVFAIIGAQETQAANMRSRLELQGAERILARIEAEVPDLYSRNYDLLIIGHLPSDAYQKFVRFPWRANRPNLSFSILAVYNQVDYLNLLAGRDVFNRVRSENRDALLSGASSRPAWPAPGSVFVEGDTVVVKLEPYHEGIELTDRR